MIDTINDWKLARKVLVAFVVIGALLAVLAGSGIYTTNQMAGIAHRHITRGVAGATAIAHVLDEVREERIIVYSYYAAMTEDDMRSLEDRFEKTQENLVKKVDAYADVAGDGFEPEVERLRAAVEALHSANQQIFAARARGDLSAALALIKGEGKRASHAMIEQSDRLQQMGADRSAEADEAGTAFVNKALWVAITLTLLALSGLAIVWFLIQKTIARPMEQLATTTTALAAGGSDQVPHQKRGDELGAIAKAVETFRQTTASRAEADARTAAEQQLVTSSLEQSLEALSKGDLTAEVRADFPATYQTLKTNFNAALSNLRDLIGSVMESTQGLRTGSHEIAQASEDLARRTESNAASLEETSAALTQIDGRIKATAEAAGRTVERADQAISTVSGGRSIADEAVQAMGRVRESAKGIDEVIEGVDKIAFQTRVLAMNAAVEAGRAGDAGRGFAVVADLVSALAMRAEEEAKRARDQLTVTQTDIVTAVDAVQKVDGALAGISEGVGEVHELLGSMASDNQAQASAITQISAAVTSMDQATQQNAAMVEETSAAARNLNVEAEALAEKAAQFRIDEARARAASRPVAVAAKGNAYVSPVKPLPAAMPRVQGNAALALDEAQDWKDF